MKPIIDSLVADGYAKAVENSKNTDAVVANALRVANAALPGLGDFLRACGTPEVTMCEPAKCWHEPVGAAAWFAEVGDGFAPVRVTVEGTVESGSVTLEYKSKVSRSLETPKANYWIERLQTYNKKLVFEFIEDVRAAVGRKETA